jgi:excisionase family DNA binding protein
VAAHFQVDPATVRRWIRGGRIAGERTPGGHWRVKASALEEK